MDIVKVINQYIADDESSLGNDVEDSILDLETVFGLEDDAIFDSIKKTQSMPLGFSLGRIGGVRQNKVKSNLQAIAKDIERSYKECICEVKARLAGCSLKISATNGYALFLISYERRFETIEIRLLIVK